MTLPFLSTVQKWSVPCILLISFLWERKWLHKLAKTAASCRDHRDDDHTTWRPQKFVEDNDDDASKSPRKILYVPLDNVETSILGSVFLRMDRHYDTIKAAVGTPPFPDLSSSSLTTAKGSRSNSLRWTFLRDPAARAKSEFFSKKVSWQEVEPAIQNYERFLEETVELDHYYLRTLLNETKDMIFHSEIAHVERILREQYHFIGITERLHESLVVMKLLWGLNTTDLLYITAPNDLLDFNDTSCIYLTEPFSWQREREVVTPWQRRIAGDVILYREAVAKLDATIDFLGRGRVQRHIQEYVRLLQFAHEQCYESATFPCDLNGHRVHNHTCLFDDIGCGYKCLDQLELRPKE